jgi:hypothetical protein
MKKIVGILLIILVLGVGAYLLMKKSPQSSTNQAPVATQNKPDSTKQTIQGTLKSLLSAGKSQKCTYSNKAESASINGTIYITSGKMRGDFVSGTEEKKVNGHMIVDGKFSYVWSDLSKQGIKMAYDPNEQAPTSVPANTNNQTPDINQTFAYTCQGWTENNTVFVPPTDITFSEFAMPSVVVPSDAATNPSACSACDNLPEGTTRDTCKTQLNCK